MLDFGKTQSRELSSMERPISDVTVMEDSACCQRFTRRGIDRENGLDRSLAEIEELLELF